MPSVCWRARMSTNTTSTSDRLGSASPTLSSAQEPTQQEGTQKYQGVPVSMSAVPDAAVIARLANEFFAALPGGAAPPRPTVPAVPGIPGNVPPAAIPDFPREAF